MAKSTLRAKWSFRKQLLTLYYALRDNRTPWYARATAISSIIYLFSPIDILPDVIPLAGYLDDLFIVPFLIDVSARLLPPEVKLLAEQRARARGKKIFWVIISIVVLIAAAIAFYMYYPREA